MKHTFQWILVAVCLFVVGTAQVMGDDGDDEKISVPIGTGDIYTGNGNVSITGKRVELQSGTKITQGAVLKINSL